MTDLPDGVIDTPELFFSAIREKAAMPDAGMVEDAIKFLESESIGVLRKIDANWEGNGRRYRMAFWTGAFLGARVSWHRYLAHLRAEASKSGGVKAE